MPRAWSPWIAFAHRRAEQKHGDVRRRTRPLQGRLPEVANALV
jgi:hypothetical protein